ncbi:MAG: energy transducer TonB [Bacteroidota bacterium]
MRLFLFTFFLLTLMLVASSQEVTESNAEYPGGIKELYKYISEELVYPKTAKKQKIEGRVMLSFVIDTTGSVTDVEIVKGIGGGCDEEAVRVLKNIPEKFKPAYQKGKAVRVRMGLPIQFKRGK